MACMLRLNGGDVDLKRLTNGSSLEINKIWIKGEPKFEHRQDKVNDHSSLNIIVSDAEWEEFSQQKNDAERYLAENFEELKRVVNHPGIIGACLDFGIVWRDVLVQQDYFPPNLIKLAAEIGLGIELSQYSPSDD